MPQLDHRAGTSTPLRTKVPEITVLFWVVKLLTTGVGEAASDYLAATSITLAGAVGLLGFLGALWWQLRTRAYSPVPYWLAVSMVAVFGTIAADGLHKVIGLPYGVTTTLYAFAVVVVFVTWHRAEHTLSIHSITTRRREMFYWATVLATFALGTAAGDVAALTLHLGYFAAAALFGVAILVPAVAWWRRWLNPIAAFWCAYVLTRPLGASIADWLGKPTDRTGSGYGDGVVTVVGAVTIAALVGWLAADHRRAGRDDNVDVGASGPGGGAA